MFRTALVASEKALGPEAADLSFFLAGIGHAYLDLKKPADAIAPLERALKVRGTGGDPMSTAEISFGLARALWASKRDRARARALAEAALPHYQAAGNPDVKAWLASPN
jgi:hypothetical protein